MKRWREQRWILDNVIRANGVDWDQPRTVYLAAPCGLQAAPDFEIIRQRACRTTVWSRSPRFPSWAMHSVASLAMCLRPHRWPFRCRPRSLIDAQRRAFCTRLLFLERLQNTPG
jgi:hypothetical protein